MPPFAIPFAGNFSSFERLVSRIVGVSPNFFDFFFPADLAVQLMVVARRITAFFSASLALSTAHVTTIHAMEDG